MLDMIQNKPLEKFSQRGEQGYGMKITDSRKRLLWHRTYECMLEKTRKHFTLDRNIKNTRNRITKKARSTCTAVAKKVASPEFRKNFMVLVLLKYLIYINKLYIVGKSFS